MARFRGSYDYSIDAKGRLNIPAKFRKSLSPEAMETFVVTVAPDSCLRAYPLDEWEKYEDELASRPQSRATTKLRRLIYANTSESVLDSQGRISLQLKQIQKAGLGKEVTLIGQPGFIEIWDPKRHDEYLGEGDEFDDVFYESENSAREG